MAKPKPLPVHIVLDTSCLFTDAADKLIREELSEFILSTIGRKEIDVTWHLPSMTRDERKHQMLIRAERLIPQLEKVERLLGHKFGITQETLEQRVEAVISREVARHNLKLRSLDTSDVDWDDLISRSVQRRPPFDPGEKEKGFRDAVVLETFRQIIADLPKNAKSCRIVLMSDDKLMGEAARELANGHSNVAYTGDLEEIQTILNALASELTQEVVDKVLPAASALFWAKGDQTTLYAREKIPEKILSQFEKELEALPSGFTRSVTKQVLIRAPAFLSKANQRLTFSSRVTFEVEATKTVWRPPPATGGILAGLASLNPPPSPSLANQSGGLGLLNLGLGSQFANTPATGTSTFGSIAPSTGPLPSLQHLSNPSPPPSVQEQIRRAGRHVFEVFWSAILTASGSVKNARIENIEYKESKWEEEP